MKYIYYKVFALALLATAFSLNVTAQIELPAPSPTATFSQKVGLTEVTITYSRPGVKDRKIFGDLVPYGELWRTGANMATRVKFSDDVKLAGNDLPAGEYALFTIPGESEWTVIFNKNVNQGGTGNYSEGEDALRFNVKPKTVGETIETFAITINNVRPNSADLILAWDKTVVEVPLEVEIDEKIMASIDRALTVQPGDLFQAATYYHESGKDLNKALEMINEAVAKYEAEGQNVFWVYRRKSLIQADLKQYKDAIATAETCKAKAKEAGNGQYVKFSEDSIAEWKAKM